MAGVFGNRIRQVRELLGMNQLEFSNKLDLGQVALSRYETEQRQPERETIIKIAKLADASLDWLLTGRGWMCVPHNSQQAENWVLERIGQIQKIIIVTYEDGRFGKANGFILVTGKGSITVEGGTTRSGYVGGGPNAYRRILEALNKRSTPASKLDLDKESTPEWNNIELLPYVLKHKPKPIDISAELTAIRPDLYSKQGAVSKARGSKECAATHVYEDADLIELVEILQHDLPEMKNHVLKLLRGMRTGKK